MERFTVQLDWDDPVEQEIILFLKSLTAKRRAPSWLRSAVLHEYQRFNPSFPTYTDKDSGLVYADFGGMKRRAAEQTEQYEEPEPTEEEYTEEEKKKLLEEAFNRL